MAIETDVLIVEDDDDTRSILEAVLLEEGLQVYCAKNGALAIEWLKMCLKPKVILLDYMMPDCGGNDFIKAIQTLSESIRSIPVIVLSAMNLKKLESEIKPLVFDIVAKPFELDDLMRVILSFATARLISIQNPRRIMSVSGKRSAKDL